MMGKRKLDSGFTVIELVVVIGIIAVLAPMLSPTQRSGRERAAQVGCLNNLRQLGEAFQAYCEDWDKIFPLTRVFETLYFRPSHTDGGITYWKEPGWAGVYSRNDWLYWHVDPRLGSLWPYVENKRIYLCPNDRNSDYAKTYPLSYSMNSVLSWRNCETMKLLPNVPQTCNYGLMASGRYGQGLLNNSRSKLLVLIHPGGEWIADRFWVAMIPEYNWWDAYPARPKAVHFDGTNILYADWHVQWQTVNAIEKARLDLEWHPDR